MTLLNINIIITLSIMTLVNIKDIKVTFHRMFFTM